MLLVVIAIFALGALLGASTGLTAVVGKEGIEDIGEVPGRKRKLLDLNWRFHRGHAADVAKDFRYGTCQGYAKAGSFPGAAAPAFDDSGWAEVRLPHDWVVETDFVMPGEPWHRAHGSRPVGRNYPDNAVGWYRRRFRINPNDAGQRISLEFDGVFRECIVYVNGHQVGRNQSGYIGFRCDITDFVDYDGENILVVRVDASQYEGWFYEGAGIYRHVWLVITNPVHVPQYGTYVVSEIGDGEASVTIETEITNESDVEVAVGLQSRILDPSAATAAIALGTACIGPWQTKVVTQVARVASPKLWSPEEPNLYRLQTSILSGGLAIDETEATFGIRTIRFDANEGFFLNGKRVFIAGTCNHQDHAGVGSALPDALQAFRIRRLKEMGSNAYRSAHNPAAPEILDECDRQGMMVCDEVRLLDSSPEGLSHAARMVRRGRNHPSIILWSIGNEEWVVQGTDRGARIAKSLIRTVRALDDTRPITCATNNGEELPGINEVIPVRGHNYYRGRDMDGYHERRPEQPVLATEEASTLSTRGEYANDPEKGYMAAYDTERPDWGATGEEWLKFYQERPWMAGAFVWTGFDYRGEPTPYDWPCISSHFGILDTCGFPKDLFYYYQAWWCKEDVVHLLPHWNWPNKEGEAVAVWCYANTEEVELLLDGVSLGRAPMPRLGHVEWSVPFHPGTLEARGYRGGRAVKSDFVATTGPAAAITLTPDRETINADGEDVAVITVAVVDAQGRVVPTSDNDIELVVSGPSGCTVLGVGNGDPSSHEADKFEPRHLSIEPAPWTMVHVPNAGVRPKAVEWGEECQTSVTSGADQLPPNTAAAFRTTFQANKEMRNGDPALHIGQISDEGHVYLNGKLLGKADKWDQLYRFPLDGAKSPLKLGLNHLVVVVENKVGSGGLGGSVSIDWRVPAAVPHRKVFHGLAQAIVGSAQEAGPLTLIASAPGLTSATLVITAREFTSRTIDPFATPT